MPGESRPIPNSRIFEPSQYFLGPPDRAKTLEQSSDIVHHILSYDSNAGVTRLVVNNLKARRKADRTLRIERETAVIAIDGVTREDEDDDEVRTSYGIYFGKNSNLNDSSIVPKECSQTKELALLLGTSEALKSISENIFFAASPHSASASDSATSTPEIQAKSRIVKVVIITDSPYLVKCMTDWVWVWQSKGYLNSKGEWVSNHVEIAGLANACLEIERFGGEVRFWLVEKGGVGDARRLANQVLNDTESRDG
ncbi:hypothetical protein EG329_007535 [Mollisiaceae sp. DMI_Dod_QoI]|nr:hypothetical protein EG329_007535 [Helotiales sp. DMI_Dod_QoI]